MTTALPPHHGWLGWYQDCHKVGKCLGPCGCVWSAFPWSTVWTNKILSFDRSRGSSCLWATPNRRLARFQHSTTLLFYYQDRVILHWVNGSLCHTFLLSTWVIRENISLPKKFFFVFMKIFYCQNKPVYCSTISSLHHPMHSMFRSVISYFHAYALGRVLVCIYFKCCSLCIDQLKECPLTWLMHLRKWSVSATTIEQILSNILN